MLPGHFSVESRVFKSLSQPSSKISLVVTERMAVPGRRNGLREDDEEELEEGIFDEEEGALDWSNDEGIPPHLQSLALAAESGNANDLQDSLDNLDWNIDDPIEDGDTLLHLCCLFGHLPCVQLLLNRGANIEVKDEEGALPLHDACAGGFTEIVQLLFSFGDSHSINRMIDTADHDGDTPLHHAARGQHLTVVKLLLSAGASPSTRNIYGKTPAEVTDPQTEVRQYLENEAISANSVPSQ